MNPKRQQVLVTIDSTPDSDKPLTLALTMTTPAKRGTPVDGGLVAEGGTGGYVYAIIAGSLPAGVSLNTGTGALTGTPTTAGRYEFTASVQDSSSTLVEAMFSLSVLGTLVPVASTPRTLVLNYNPPALSTSYRYVFSVSGNVGAVTYSLVSGSLPTGLTLTGSGVNAGRIGTSTTVTTVPDGGSYYYFTVRATDAGTGETLDMPASLHVIAVQKGSWDDYNGVYAWYSGELPPLKIGESRTYRFTTIRGRGVPPFTWSWGGHASLTPFVTLTPVNGTLDCDVTIYGDPSLISNTAYFVSLHCVGQLGMAMNFPGTTGYTPSTVSLRVMAVQSALLPQKAGVDVGTAMSPNKINFAGGGVSSVTNSGGVWTVTIPTGAGGVTSVGLSLPAIFNVGGSPVTTTGTLTATLATQSPNVVWAGPASGGAAAPAFRALTVDDLPNTLQRMLSAQAPAADTIANTAVSTTFATSYTIPAAALKAGCLVRVRAQGAYATAAAAPTLTLHLRVTGTTILTIGALTMPAGAPNPSAWFFEGDFFIPSIGPAVACRANGHAMFGVATNIVNNFIVMPQSTAVNQATTSNRVITLAAQWGTANVANTITLQQLSVEVLG